MSQVTALIADDEPLLRKRLVQMLGSVWPELKVVAEARNGRQAVEMFETHSPQVVFLDVHMPGQSGIDAARSMIGQTQIVFATAYEQYAVQAFEQGAIDYLVKPFNAERLAQTVARLQARVQARLQTPLQEPGETATEPLSTSTLLSSPASALEPSAMDTLLAALSAELRQRNLAPGYLQWIKASVGNALQLIPVAQVHYMRSDLKYTLVRWDGGEALIRKTIRELADELDPERFVQIHRSVIVNLTRVRQVTRGPNETADVHLQGHDETLPVSRSYLHLFRQM